jgi:hypothetical protein
MFDLYLEQVFSFCCSYIYGIQEAKTEKYEEIANLLLL